MTRISRLSLLVLPIAAAALVLGGCAAGSLGAQGAGSGAKSGALGGAVAGAVGSLFFGGNVLQNMATTAVIGAASGAVIGGVSGNAQDKQIEAKRSMSQVDADLLARIGPDNFAAAKELAYCKHKTAIGKARTAYGRATNDDHRRYALMIEAISYEEMGDTAAAQQVYPLLTPIDPQHTTIESARSDALAGILKVQKARQDRGLPPICH